MGQWWFPRFFLPTHPQIRRFWGIIHRYLRRFSRSYCGRVGIAYDNQIAQLPFGLILKWSDGTRIEEVLTMQVARKAGLPVPRVICYGEHPDSPHAPISILMTRVPGKELGQVYETFNDEDKDAVLQQLDQSLKTIRKWKSPWGENRICSLLGTPLRSVRVPNHLAGPFESEQELNDYLREPAWLGGFPSEMAYNEALHRARRMDEKSHNIVFTHGDLQHHNIMVHEGRISGFLDWEAAGWYPDYWEFTTALRFAQENFWWYHFVVSLGRKSYLLELDSERALTSLTSASYYW
ncbi:kinase-like protein [Aspergillus sclerotioniger CBS 115572]|uniref:Kinase-like protein n=1 Tax=Aspergillus sclerotioniger CBS 115572 TaxID=1450535 RepID=A0A317W432_9EURO|nr:kinase-like protein [Aspergillus sclerotioniger CBS 115572]PWY80765.1 kinase-like protein [Aspergillus sclerotioniger CBS 115572]